MAVQGFGAGDFAALAKFAWNIYDNVRESRTNFGKLNIDVECLLVSIGSLDKGHTQELIIDYIENDDGETRQTEVRALRDGLNSVIMPFYALFDSNLTTFKTKDGTKSPRALDKSGMAVYVQGPDTGGKPAKERPWRRWPATSWIQRLIVAFELKDLTELRSRFAVQAANLNLFMTRLTHTQLQRQAELLTLRLSEQSLLDETFRYSRDLVEGAKDFRSDVASYVKFLIDGGKPFSSSELSRRKAETRKANESGALVHFHEYKRMLEEENRNKSSLGSNGLDDDARIKLALARERLALANIQEDQSGYDPDATRGTLTTTKQPQSILVRRKSEPGQEEIVMPGSFSTASSSKGTSQELVRRSSSVFVCDICDRHIGPDKTFFRCESDKCGDKGDSFDICKRCYAEGHNCPGFGRGKCGDMVKIMWKEQSEG